MPVNLSSEFRCLNRQCYNAGTDGIPSDCVATFCFPGTKAVDGIYHPIDVHEFTSIAVTQSESNPWLQIDLTRAYCISAVKIWNRNMYKSGINIVGTKSNVKVY